MVFVFLCNEDAGRYYATGAVTQGPVDGKTCPRIPLALSFTGSFGDPALANSRSFLLKIWRQTNRIFSVKPNLETS